MPTVQVYSSKEKGYITKIVNLKPRHVTAFMEKHEDPTGVHCMYCKKKLFESQLRLIELVPGAPPQELRSMQLKCPNPNCNTFWWFVGTF